MAKYHLFDVVGVELEYMLVDNATFKVAPVVDALMTKKNNGQLVADISNGTIDWSNELTAHVVELKTSAPVNTIDHLDKDFHQNILEINQLLNSMR